MRCDKAKIVLACLAAAFAACGLMAEEKVATWKGRSTSDPNVGRQWYNSANWVEGVIPGRYLDKDEQGNTITSGSYGWTARFSRSDAQWKVLPGMGGELVSISNIVFTGNNSTMAVGDKWHYVYLEDGGGIYVEDSNTQNITFNAFVGTAGMSANTTFHIRNDSSKRLTLANGFAKFNVMPGISSLLMPHVRFEGSGKTYLCGAFPKNSGFRPYLDVALSEGGELHVTNTVDNFLGVYVPSGLPAQHIVVKSGSLLKPGVLSNSEQVRVYSDTEISGDGKLSLNLTTEASSHLYVGPGAVMTIGTAVTNRNNTADASFRVSGKGIVRFTGRNTIPQDIDIRTAIVEARTIGMAGEEGDIGLGRSIKIEQNGMLRYTGSGETTDRAIVLGYYTNVLEQAGTGPVTFTGNVVSSNYLGTIVFCNDTEFPATLSGRILTGTYSPIVIKRGTGEWILSGANNTQGMFYLEGGTLTVGSASSLPRLTIAGESTTLKVADNVALSLPTLVRRSGDVNVVLGNGATLRATGLARGKAPTWLTVNGRAAAIGADGDVHEQKGFTLLYR